MVSIVIISYNRSNLLRECLSSLYKNLKGDFEVIVVDHDSKDDSVEMVKKNFPKAITLDTKKNPGFGTGCNIGAKNSHGDTIVFLNSDAEVSNNSLFDMEHFLHSKESIGIVGGLLENRDKTPQRSYGRFYNLPQVVRLLFGGDSAELAFQNTKDVQEVDWVSGGYMMIKRSVFEKVKGFDEKIFMYIEDMELCYRVRKAGYSIFFYPKAQVFHLGQGSSNRTFAIVYIFRGLEYFYKKHKSYSEYIILKLLLFTKAILAIGIGIVTRNRYLTQTYSEALKI